MTDLIQKHSIVLAGRKTSVALEPPFWRAFKQLAQVRGVTISALADAVNTARKGRSLSSSIRLFVLDAAEDQRDYFRTGKTREQRAAEADEADEGMVIEVPWTPDRRSA